MLYMSGTMVPNTFSRPGVSIVSILINTDQVTVEATFNWKCVLGGGGIRESRGNLTMIVGSWNHHGKKKNTLLPCWLLIHVYTQRSLWYFVKRFYFLCLDIRAIVHKLIYNIGSNCFVICHCLDVLNSRKKISQLFFILLHDKAIFVRT